MKQLLKTEDFRSPLKYKNNFTIDNTNISAVMVAKIIKEKFNL